MWASSIIPSRSTHGSNMKISFLNHNGQGFARDVQIPYGATLGYLINNSRNLLGYQVDHYGATLKISGNPATINDQLFEGASVEVINVQATAQAVPREAGDRNISVMLVDNSAGGFADRLVCPAGTEIGDFFAMHSRQSDGQIRVNRRGTTVTVDDREFVLQDGDRISVTPMKIDGGSGTIRVHLVVNSGAGFSDPCDVVDGTTIGRLFSARFPNDSANKYMIRVSRPGGAPTSVSADYVLLAGDRVSMVPMKVDGGSF